MSEHTVFLDIETIPTQSLDMHERLTAEVKAPGNIKKPESIAAWMKENAEAAAAEAIAKTSFDPAAGHICTISWAIDDGEPEASHTASVGGERVILQDFFGAIDEFHRHTFVGHFIGGFDLRFILCRAVVLGVRIPQCIPRDPKPWDG